MSVLEASPVLSVVIPTFNRALLLKRCLESVLQSSRSDIEVLVADNCSPDGTQDVLRACKDPRIRHWRNATNVGADRNTLNLLRKARGEWVFCLTDDDVMLPGALERLLEVVEAQPEVGVVMSSLQQVNANGDLLTPYRFHDCTAKFAPGGEALVKMVRAAHVLSRITLRRAWLDLDGAERHLNTMYPQMYYVGSILKEHSGLYLDELLVQHTVGNEVFWEFQADYMLGARLAMFKEMLPDARWRQERKALTQHLIAEAVICNRFALQASPARWLHLQRALLNHREFALSRYWLDTALFFARLGLRLTRQALIADLTRTRTKKILTRVNDHDDTHNSVSGHV